MKVNFWLIGLLIVISGCASKTVDKKSIDKDVVTQKPSVKVVPKTVKKEISKNKIEEISKSYKVTMKTKKFAFSDTGFLVQSKDQIRLNVLAVGKSVLDLKIKKSDDICVGSLCNTKHGFNQSFLSGDYPDDLTEKVLLGKPILSGKNLTKTATGFIQQIKDKNFNIKYQTAKGSIYFKDGQNKIIIKLKELKK
ncbi:MAG: hypothetical protein K0U47_08155 [Epsilonproteobacteria bacterium]|nr:hypothetical protein [Campylobacterota bacterium]